MEVENPGAFLAAKHWREGPPSHDSAGRWACPCGSGDCPTKPPTLSPALTRATQKPAYGRWHITGCPSTPACSGSPFHAPRLSKAL